MTDLIGQVLFEQYRVDAFIASGGMGAVYRVWDLKRNVPLAMKTLHGELAEDPHIYKHFEREARALKKLAHPNIVPFYGLYDAGEFVFLLQRYIDGPSLAAILKQQKGVPIPIEQTLTYFRALTSALGYAHANNVIHCDVKPGNVLIDRGGNIYLTDFGIARHAESTTTTMGTAGTPAYMAPEQIRGETVTSATDIYALGIMLFEMLTGQRPFRGVEAGTSPLSQTAAERIRQEHLHVSPPNPQQINPSISSDLSAVILKCLEKRPEDRFTSTQEMFNALCAAASIPAHTLAERIEITNAAAAGYTFQQTKPAEAAKLPQKHANGQTPKLFLLGVGLLASLLLAFGIWGFTKLSSPQGQPAEAASQIDGQIALDNHAIDTPVPTINQVLSATETFTPAPTPTSIPSPTAPQLTNLKDGAQLIVIPSGEFVMGSNQEDDPYFWGAEGPSHKIFLKDFYIYRTEVTNGMYALCTQEKQCPKPSNNTSQTRKNYFNNPQFKDHPVVLITWVMAKAYCQWAGGRLPTEAEWEKAARGSDGRLFPWGNDAPQKSLANFSSPDTVKVGKYPNGASPYGVLDMAGNVLEWVNDIYKAEYYKVSPEENPLGPDTGSRRGIRGGSWHSSIDGLRTVARASLELDDSNNSVGFRCVKDTP